MRHSAALLAILTAVAAATPINRRQAASWPDPEPCTGNCTYIHDPALIRRDDGTWFRISTNGNIAIASAPALNGPWTYQGAMMPQGSMIHATNPQQLWAPDVHKSGDTYYAYYAASISGSQQSDIGVCTSTTLEVGSWTDHGSVGIPKSTAYNLIDPNWFNEDPSQPYFLNFGSAWNDIYQTQVDAATQLSYVSSAPPGREIFNSTVPNEPSPPPANPQTYPSIVEGSYEFWLPDVQGQKAYFMFFSSGACCNDKGSLAAPGEEYKVFVCRSSTALGPFTDDQGRSCLTGNGGTLVLGSHGSNVYAPGGQGVMINPDNNRPIMYYHYVNPTLDVADPYAYENFQFGYNYLDFSSGWPVVVSE